MKQKSKTEAVEIPGYCCNEQIKGERKGLHQTRRTLRAQPCGGNCSSNGTPCPSLQFTLTLLNISAQKCSIPLNSVL